MGNLELLGIVALIIGVIGFIVLIAGQKNS